MERVPHRRRIREQRGRNIMFPHVYVGIQPPSELKWLHDVVRCGSTGRSHRRADQSVLAPSRGLNLASLGPVSARVIKIADENVRDTRGRSGARSPGRSFRIIESPLVLALMYNSAGLYPSLEQHPALLPRAELHYREREWMRVQPREIARHNGITGQRHD